MQQVKGLQRDSDFQDFERCLKITETPMEWADEQGQAWFQRVKLNVKNQFASDPRKPVCKVLQTLDENPAQ
jgi:hypothetical protein